MDSDNIKLAQVIIDAWVQNRWHVIAASSDRHSDGKRPSGVVAFTRPEVARRNHEVRQSQPGIREVPICGTARFYVNEDLTTVFHGGNYDLGRMLAIQDFVERSDRS